MRKRYTQSDGCLRLWRKNKKPPLKLPTDESIVFPDCLVSTVREKRRAGVKAKKRSLQGSFGGYRSYEKTEASQPRGHNTRYFHN